MSDWYSSTDAVETVDVEICFLLETGYNTTPVPLPAIPRHVESLIRTSELAGHETLLVQYYQQVLKLAKVDERTFNEIAHYFWLRLFFWNTEAGIHVSFPWYDTYAEMKTLLQKILSDESGELFSDQDQGWEINIERHDGRIFIRQWDPDSEEIHTLVNFPDDSLKELISLLMARTEKVIGELSRLLGGDVWTRRVKEPQFHLLGQERKNSWWKRIKKTD